MPHKHHTDSPYWWVRVRLPGLGRTRPLNTKVRNKRTAQTMERMVHELAERSLTDLVLKEILDKLLAGELALPEVFSAYNFGRLDKLSSADSLVRDAIRSLERSTKDRHLLMGAKELADRTPRGARISWLTPRHIMRICEESEQEGRKRNSVRRRLLRAISHILRRELGNAARNLIMDDVIFPAEDDSRKVHLKPPEIIRLLGACEGEFRAFVMTAILTGADRGVLCNLKRRDIELWDEDGLWSGTIYLEDRKSESRSRTVSIGHELALSLYEVARLRMPAAPVFKLKYSQVDYLWQTARSKAELEHVRFKDLRHTFAVLCHTAGIDLNTVKAGMGHQRLSTTTRYTDHDIAFSTEHAQAIGNLLRTG